MVAGVTILIILAYITYYVFPCAKRICKRIEGHDSDEYLAVSEKKSSIKKNKSSEPVLMEKEESSI